MTPFSYDYKNRTLRGVIVNGVPYYDVTSVLECVGYSKPKRSNGWGGKMYYLLDMMPGEETTRIKSRLYCTEAGVRYLHTNLMARKGIRDRAEKDAFFQWFDHLMNTKQTAAHDDASTATMPEQTPADDAALTVKELQEILTERNKKIDELSKQLEETQEDNIKLFNDSMRESRELKDKIDDLQHALNKEREYHRRVVMKLLNIEEG